MGGGCELGHEAAQLKEHEGRPAEWGDQGEVGGGRGWSLGGQGEVSGRSAGGRREVGGRSACTGRASATLPCAPLPFTLCRLRRGVGRGVGWRGVG